MPYIARRALSGSSTAIPRYRTPRLFLGSLGDDTSSAGTTLAQPTLAQPTLTDPATVQWQGNVLTQLQAGVATLQKAELQKWLQIAATLSIPLAAAIWKMIFKRGAANISGE
jgi:hypothetical protein